jgi:hypothetical protein
MLMLRWSIALVLGFGAAALLVHHDHAGIEPAVAIALAVVELAFAVLFAIPRTTRPGGFGLLAVLAAAAVVHIAIGQPPPIAFVVYAAAIWVVIKEKR